MMIDINLQIIALYALQFIISIQLPFSANFANIHVLLVLISVRAYLVSLGTIWTVVLVFLVM